jgi:hypothetical protein
MRLIRFLISMNLLLPSSLCFGKSQTISESMQAPKGVMLARNEGASWIEFHCKFSDNFQRGIHCKFLKTSIDPPKPFDKKKFWETANSPSVKKEFQASLELDCKDPEKEKYIQMLDKESKQSGPKLSRILSQHKDKFLRACSTKNVSLLIEIEELREERKAKTCVLKVSEFEQDFTKNGDSWVSEPSPPGFCGQSIIEVLSGKGIGDWTLTKTPIAVAAKTEICDSQWQKEAEKTVIYSNTFPLQKEIEGCEFFSSEMP